MTNILSHSKPIRQSISHLGVSNRGNGLVLRLDTF